MSDQSTDKELSTWFSTYGLLTATRIFERLHIQLTTSEIKEALTNSCSLYYQLVRVPLKNVFTGIIHQQAYDYQVYVQKLFIDYLLSGEAGKDEESPGATTREDLELKRAELVVLVESFSQTELKYQQLIAQSQRELIKLGASLKKALEQSKNELKLLFPKMSDSELVHKLRGALIHSVVSEGAALSDSESFMDLLVTILELSSYTDLKKQLVKSLSYFDELSKQITLSQNIYLEQAQDMEQEMRMFRSKFYEHILSVTAFISFLPDYRVNQEQDIENRSTLLFDQSIGGL
jgi:hypothetical protein